MVRRLAMPLESIKPTCPIHGSHQTGDDLIHLSTMTKPNIHHRGIPSTVDVICTSGTNKAEATSVDTRTSWRLRPINKKSNTKT